MPINHSHQPDFPPVVYKYRTWSKVEDRFPLLNNTLYLSSPASFNDPFDCRIPPNYYLLNTEQKLREYAEFKVGENREFLLKNGANLSDEIESICHKLSNAESLRKFQLESNSIHFESQNNHLGVLCLSERFDSPAMWAHYAENQKGYCIGFSEEKLRRSELFGKGGRVRYNNTFPEILPVTNLSEEYIKNSFLETHTKSADWSYEEEYRLTKLFYPNVPTNADRTINIPNDFIVEVIIGLNMEDEVRSIVLDISRKKGFPVYKIEQVPFSFSLQKVSL